MSTSQYAAHDGGFLVRRKTSPIGIGGAIAIHVGVVAVVLLMPGVKFTPTFHQPTLPTRNIPLDKPPPKHITPPKQPNTTQTPVIYTPPSVVSLKRDPDIFSPYTPPSLPPMVDPGPVPTATPPPHKAVFVESRMDPRFARNLQPDYPPARLREEEEGKVTVRVRIGADGRVLSVEQVFTSHPDFWRATQVQALKAWRFLPATRDGMPVESERVMTVYFKMQDQ